METIANTSEQKSLFSSLLDALESKEIKSQAEREFQEKKYLLRTQRIFEFHERQRRDVAELRRCLQYVGSHAQLLESALRAGAGDAEGGGEGAVGLSAALVRQAGALQRSMQQCVGDAARIRAMVASRHHPHIDALLAKMESELGQWSAFVTGASHALLSSGALLDNLHNLIAVQQRCVSEVSASELFASQAMAEAEAQAGEAPSPPPAARAACSTPIASD